MLALLAGELASTSVVTMGRAERLTPALPSQELVNTPRVTMGMPEWRTECNVPGSRPNEVAEDQEVAPDGGDGDADGGRSEG